MPDPLQSRSRETHPAIRNHPRFRPGREVWALPLWLCGLTLMIAVPLLDLLGGE